MAIASMLVATAMHAQLANQPPAPLWLTARSPDQALTTTFQQHGKLLRAILLIAADKPVRVQLGSHDLGSLAGGEIASSVDVTRYVQTGDNRLSIHIQAGRVAALLELNGDLAQKTWLGTDASWQGVGEATVIDPTGTPFDLKKTFDAYNSWQLAKPGVQSQATPVADITAPAGFRVELIRSAQPGEDSWVSMAFDPKGRITLAKEKKGLLRFDPRSHSVEVINDSLLECRGLLYAHGALFANANNSHALYRLRDSDGDDRFDEERELLHTDGGVGHGRNHIKLGPDGDIYIAHGNNVLLPTNISDQSPLRHYANEQLLPNAWDGSMFDGNVELPAGHILRIKADGSMVQLIAGGLRNPLDIAFDANGELFTFDADMERDVGASWYMPTRVLHIVPGGDYGWRRGTGRYPAYYIDTLPSALDVGLSSPTGVFFGYGSRFPARFQRALFILDWSYGRIIAVDLRDSGASYRGTQETFISGRPLNVTDGVIGPDGALWFITGGRGTQSGLYRVSYAGDEDISPASPAPLSMEAKVRRVLESSPVTANPDSEVSHALKVALGSSDRFLWHAAAPHVAAHLAAYLDELRKGSATCNDSAASLLPGFLAADTAEAHAALISASLTALNHLASIDGKDITPAAALPASDVLNRSLPFLRALAIVLARQHDPTAEQRAKLVHYGESLMRRADPKSANAAGHASVQHFRREIAKLLIYLHAPSAIPLITDYLNTATTSEDLIFYPLHLRYQKDGWTLDQRRVVFEALNRAEKLNGASTYFKAIADTRAELASALKPQEAMQLAAVISPPKPAQLSPHALPAHSFKQWTLADLEPLLPKVASGRSFEGAKTALISVQCVFCHRVASGAELPAGIIGPDLTQVSARFGRRDLLMHILEPSKVIDEKYRSTIITRTDGTQALGTLDHEDDERVVLKPNPLTADVIEIGKSLIKERKLSEVSPMPPGLLNALKAEQILDLLAWFESGGDAKHRCWKSTQ